MADTVLLEEAVAVPRETGKHLPYLDGWRGVAVLIVVAGHFGLDHIISRKLSVFGVELFFALSGRLMAEILFVRNVPLAPFFFRRFSRVYPAFLVYVITTTLVLRGSALEHGVVAAALALTFTINYGMAFGHRVAVLDHIWSLCVEEHAYAALALIRIFSTRYRNILISIAAIAALTLLNLILRMDFMGGRQQDFAWRTDAALSSIFFGTAGWMVLRNKSLSPWIFFVSFITAIALRLFTASWISSMVIPILIALAVCTIDQAPLILRRVFEILPIRWLGLIYFSLYLWQQPFYKWHLSGGDLGIALAGTLLCATVSCYAIEIPARKYLNGIGPRL